MRLAALIPLCSLLLAPAAFAKSRAANWRVLARGTTDFGTRKVSLDSKDQAYAEIQKSLAEGKAVIANEKRTHEGDFVIAAKGGRLTTSDVVYKPENARTMSMGKFARKYKNVHITNERRGSYEGD